MEGLGRIELAIGVLIFGAIVEVATFVILYRKKQGLGANSIRVIGITAVVTFASVIVMSDVSAVQNVDAVMTILGAVAGYLFGFSEKKSED